MRRRRPAVAAQGSSALAGRRDIRRKRPPVHRAQRLCVSPQAKGLVVRISVMSPKKPNSAVRHVAKVKLQSRPRVTARHPGSGYGAAKFNRVLVRGGRANDLPGVGYSLIRGKFDFPPRGGKKRRRSFYGLKRPESMPRRPRRYLRMRALQGRGA